MGRRVYTTDRDGDGINDADDDGSGFPDNWRHQSDVDITRHPPVSTIGTEFARILHERYKQKPCGKCEMMVDRLNRYTAEQAEQHRDRIVQSVINNAKSNGAWWMRLAVTADNAVGMRHAATAVHQCLTDAISASECRASGMSECQPRADRAGPQGTGRDRNQKNSELGVAIRETLSLESCVSNGARRQCD